MSGGGSRKNEGLTQIPTYGKSETINKRRNDDVSHYDDDNEYYNEKKEKCMKRGERKE